MVKLISWYFFRMLLIGGFLWLMLSILPSCANKSVSQVSKIKPTDAPPTMFDSGVWPFVLKGVPGFPDEPQYVVPVEITKDSDIVSVELIAQVINRTTMFCVQSGEGRVSRISIKYNAKEMHTGVGYLCESQDEARQNGNSTSR